MARTCFFILPPGLSTGSGREVDRQRTGEFKLDHS